MTLLQRYFAFLRGASVSRLGRLGVILTTSSFVTFMLFEFTRILGVMTNAYIGLISYLALPALFVFGLILIPVAWQLQRRALGLTTRQLLERQFAERELSGGWLGSKFVWSIVSLTLLNVVFLSAAGSRMLTFMDEPQFCGTACHSVMHPEWTTYRDSPHARVKCVECHVGEGVDAVVDSKLNGIWQMISVTFDLYERPIPTPVHNLRPARETCETCHWPDKFYGQRIKRIVHYGRDSSSTPMYTTLSLKVGSPTRAGVSGIHWHVAADNEVRYASVDDRREQMIWVDVKQPDGTYKRYRSRRRERGMEGYDTRILDCVDCHNRATHIYEDPATAIDWRLSTGQLETDLPYLKRVALEAVTIGYPDSASAMSGIENHLYGFYRRRFPEQVSAWTSSIDETAAVLQAVYRRNRHHRMNVDWGAYPDHLRHEAGSGCFRCHNPNLKADDGSEISSDCTLCHSIAAYDSPHPFEFLLPIDTTNPDVDMHRYLQNEFLDRSSADIEPE